MPERQTRVERIGMVDTSLVQSMHFYCTNKDEEATPRRMDAQLRSAEAVLLCHEMMRNS